MGLNLGGVKYEQQVLETIMLANTILANVVSNTAAFDNTRPDLFLNVKDGQVAIEIKASPLAQLGGTSVRYNLDSSGIASYNFSEKAQHCLDSFTQDTIISTISDKKKELKNLIDYFKEQTPFDFHCNFNGMPGMVTKNAWKNSVDQDLIKPLNSYIRNDETFIHKHYSAKECFYFQIGSLGLFYLESNPLNLPIPQLRGDIQLEVRAARSGSKLNKTINERVCAASFRIQGRLKFKAEASPYSLDRPEDIRKLFDYK